MTDEQYRHFVRGFPRFIREMVDGHATLVMFFSGLALFAYLASRSLRLWAIAASAILGPAIVSLLLIVKPINPYGNLYGRLEGKSPDTARKDPNARALIEVLRSKPIKLYAIKMGAMIAFALLILVICMAKAQGPINLSFDRDQDLNWIFGDTLLLSFGCLGVEATLVLRRALKLIRQQCRDDFAKTL